MAKLAIRNKVIRPKVIDNIMVFLSDVRGDVVEFKITTDKFQELLIMPISEWHTLVRNTNEKVGEPPKLDYSKYGLKRNPFSTQDAGVE